MKRSVRVVSITFLIIMLCFGLYQTLIGNPFYDEFPPLAVMVIFFLMAIIAVIAAYREKKKTKPKEK
jgi:preprotein translocase subunit SecG